MSLIDIIKSSWFEISALISIIAFTYRVSTQLLNFQLKLKEREDNWNQNLSKLELRINKELNNVNAELEEDISQLRITAKKFEEHIEESTKRNKLIFSSLITILYELKDEHPAFKEELDKIREFEIENISKL